MIVAFEGIDGSGKSTLVRNLEAHIRERTGLDPVTIAAGCLGLWNLPAYRQLGPLTLAHLNCTRFVDSWESEAMPALAAGRIIICDRYTLTPRVRDVLRGVPDKYVRAMYSLFPPPSMLFYLDVDQRTALQRKIEADLPIGSHEVPLGSPPGQPAKEAFLSFQGACRKRYLKLLPGNAKVIDAAQNPFVLLDTVAASVLTLIDETGRPRV